MRYHKPPFILKEFKIEVTHQCNLNCIHCSSDADLSNTLEISNNDCLRILDEAISMGVKQVTFSGGEPLLWGGLEEAINAANKGGLKTSIYTSGNIDDISCKLKNLRKLGVEKCVFSIFGKNANLHERVTRQSGSFDKTIEAIKISVKTGITTELHFVPLSNNYLDLEEIAILGKKLGVSSISILRFVPQGRGLLLKKRVLTKLQNLELKRTIERLRKKGFEIRTGSPYNFLMLNARPECSSGIDRLIIGPDLRIYPCDAFKQIKAEEVVGTLAASSLNGVSLSECWQDSPFLKEVRDYLTTPFFKKCDNCKMLENCLSGCLAQKVLLYYDFRKQPDPDCLFS